ncbi:TonB-linked outer membrane protein, SusC/RagA family [Chitinophaga jiangningensis]|uniref:TonB-linked outer membrane protein, SusC/RagA family n=1 Tax=Chitinophaga jiangningensis TaxID=1419482 RepID=A0A1M6VW24_9BACT|nr:TonB-dependent receptor [Chitinophaga jiangningensis]SHK85677.1 TonB-linked outer membrane protein, SusC/RagA family [Chitinophaga jiangningensis]
MKTHLPIKRWLGKCRATSYTTRICRYGLLLLLAISMQTSAGALAQDQPLTVKATNATLETIFGIIRKQSDYLFIFRDENLSKAANRVTLSLEKATIDQVMNKCLEGTSLSYRIVDKTVILIPKKEDNQTQQVVPVSVTGTVQDANTGETLPGVTIGVKGTSAGTITNADGKFELKNVTLPATLNFTFVGFTAQQLVITKAQPINVLLKRESKDMQQVVVIGYGTQKKVDLTGAVGSFKPTDLNARPVLGPDQMMQGRIAGVNVSSGSGTPGGAVRVSIRGIGSISASNEPLYVIDGVPVMPHNAAITNFGESMNPLAELNPNDIESIDVLKDAASASIYGSRATNGVVLITTKSGKKGKGQLTVNTFASMQEVARLNKIQMANSAQYVEVANEAIDNYNNQYGYTPGNSKFIPYIYNPYPGLPETNWMNEVLRKAYTKSVDVAASGGTEKSTYYISAGYLNQQGTIKTNGLEKYMARINLTSEPVKWAKIGANMSLTYSRNNRVPGSNLGSTILGRSLPQRPFDRPYKPNGDYYVGGTSDLVYHNPVQILNEEVAYLDNYRLLGNLFAELKLAKGLTFKTSLGTDLIYTQDYIYYNQKHPYGTGNGRNVDERRLLSNILLENTLSYSTNFGKLKADFLAGQSFQRNMISSSSIDGNGFPAPSFDVLDAAAVINDAGTNLYGNAMESYFARANFAWSDKYLLALSMRTDGSSRFSPQNRYGYFPAVSAGWQVSKEPFWFSPTTDLKIRVSYGATGNQEGVSNYAYQSLTTGGYNYDGKSGISVTTTGNNDLTWEKANQLDAGIDLSLLKGAVEVTLDYFNKKTTNLLYNMPIQGTSGFTSITSNIGSMLNTGVELGLNTNVNLGPVVWNSNFNIAYVKNRITSLIGNTDVLSIGSNRGLKVGEDIGSIWVYKMTGIFQDDKEVPKPLYDIGVRAGDVKYADLNNDGNIDINDRTIVGSSNPDFYGGWNNTFRYRHFDLGVFVNYAVGADVYATWRINAEKLGLSGFNSTLRSVETRWTGPGTSNTTPRAIYNLGYNIYNSSRWLENGSFLRLRSVSLGYNIPTSLLERAHISRLRIYAQADNLWLWTKYSGLDPEVNSNMDPRFLGEDNLILPQPRSFIIGLNLGF